MNITRRNVNANGPRRQKPEGDKQADSFDTSSIEVPVKTKGKVRTAVGAVGGAVGQAAENTVVVAAAVPLAAGVAAGVSHRAMEDVMDKGATSLSDLLTHIMAENSTEEQLVKNSMRQTNGKSGRPGMLPSFSTQKSDSQELDF